MVPRGANLTQLALLNNNSRLVVRAGPAMDEHSGMLLERGHAETVVTPALLRVLRDVGALL